MSNLSVGVLLERLGTFLRSEARQRALPHSLQPVQVEALLYLSRCNRYSDTPQAVATYLSITKGTVSQTLKVLERQGLLEKRPDTADRRVVRLSLTRAGRRLARDFSKSALLEEALLAAPSREQLLSAELQGLLAELQRAAGQQTFGVCRSCRFYERARHGFRCGLTREPLSATDSVLICREHEYPTEGSPSAGDDRAGRASEDRQGG